MIAERPTRFANGALSRSAFMADFVLALKRNDATALLKLVGNRAEFG